MKLGKLPARPNAIKLKFAEIVDATALPTPPPRFGHDRMIRNNAWQMLGNDQYGDCVFAGAAHEHMLFSREGRRGSIVFDDRSVLSDYGACTGFDPSDPSTDNGTDMQAAASYRRKVGIVDSRGVRHKIDAYAEIAKADLSQVALAAWIFGACGIGVTWPESGFDQFNAGKPLDVVPGKSSILGGHYLPCIGRHKNGNYVLVTWGREIEATPAFLRAFMDEAVCYLSRDIIIEVKQETSEGFDMERLDKFLAALR